MKKYKILDFDYGCGGFTKGFEDTGRFEVIYNGSLNEKNQYCYNKVHQNKFSMGDEMPKEADLVVFTPNFGHNLKKGNSDNFRKSDYENFLALLYLNEFDNLFFIANDGVYPFLQNFGEVRILSNGFPSVDIIACTLIDLGYSVFYFVLDGAEYGMCQHKKYGVYWASRCFSETVEPVGVFGRFRDNFYLTVYDYLKDISDESLLTWHVPDYKRVDECSLVVPGSNASKTSALTQNKGFSRLKNDSMVSLLSPMFYRVSDRGPSIHPYYDRPLTIREGARLFGLSDDFDWDDGLSKKEVGLMIYESFSPFVSKYLALNVLRLFDKKK